MTVNCSLTVTGIRPEESIKAFMQSYQHSAKMSNYSKYEDQLNQYFDNKIKESIENNNIKVDGLADSFQLKVENDRIEFSSSMFEVANAYEYGSDHIYPHRFIEPAVIEIANNMSNRIINEAIDTYQKNTRIVSIKQNFNG